MSDQDPQAREPVDSLFAAGDGRHELNSMLDAIAAQLLDADRRHTSTLNQIHERIAGMGREAEMMRHRVPAQFSAAFMRIEAGVAELAQRLSQEGGGNDPAAPASHSAAPASRETVTADPHTNNPSSEAPMALRSANAPYGMDRRKAETVDRRTTPVDNFDIIESSLSGDDDPWDRQSAEALAAVYDTGAPATPRPAASTAVAAPAGEKSVITEAWLDDRFAEISRSIERSLASARSDADGNDFGRKLEKFEQHLSKMFEGVATQADIGAVRLIEAHVGEVVNHLVQTHDQLARLNVIEEQLGLISQTLVDVQGGGMAHGSDATMGSRAPAIDVDAIARAAAEHAALRFAESQDAGRHAAAAELKPLIERMMADSRQGEENTAALLDTIQQAMIRILDRVESIEFTQHQSLSTPPHTGIERSAYETAPSPAVPAQSPEALDQIATNSLTSVIAAVAATNSPPSHQGDHTHAHEAPQHIQQTAAPRRPDQQRHDFIADARRARNRLSTPDDTADVVISSSQSQGQRPSPETTKDAQPGSRPIKPVPAETNKRAGPSGPSPRLIVIALGVIVLLSGLWYTFGGGETTLPGIPALLGGSAGMAPDDGKAHPQNTEKPASSDMQPLSEPDTNGKRGDITPDSGTDAAAVTAEAPVPRTTLPLIGVAVDVDHPISATEMQQAIRHQSMATMSGDIGAEAAKSPAVKAIPASIVPSQSETSGEIEAPGPSSSTSSGASSGLTRAKRMTDTDMPPASLGPLSLRLAAANGDPSAEFEVGARLAEGKGKTANFKDAAKWYQKSADAGFAQAQYRLGTLYERGLGVKADRALAIKWYELAAAQGNIKAMHNLAVLSSNQNDKSPDYATAAHWFEEAAKRDLSDSQFNLAILYENGLGVPKDLKTAFMWLSLAAREGDAEAVRRRDILRGKLTAEETSAADDLIASWKSIPYDRTVNDARAAGEAWKKNPNNGISG